LFFYVLMKLLGLLSTGIVGAEMNIGGVPLPAAERIALSLSLSPKVLVTICCQFFVQVPSAVFSDNDPILLITPYSRKVCIPF